MAGRFPLKVVLMDMDCFALDGLEALFSRDARTLVTGRAETAPELLQALKDCPRADAVVIGARLQPGELVELAASVRRQAPGAKLIYLAQAAEEDLLQAAVQAGVDGCLLRGEVRVGVVWAVVWACQGEFVYSQGLAPQLKALLPLTKRAAVCIQPWEPSAQLSPRLLAGFWMRVILGLRASQAAQRMGVEAGTVERYITHAYQALQGSEPGEDGLRQVDLDGLSPEERNFLFYTLPKRGR